MKNKDAASIWTTPPAQLSAMKRGGKKAGAKARGGVPMAGKPQAGAQTRGGGRRTKAEPALAVDKPAAVAVKPAKAKAKATPTMTKGSMKRSAMPKAEMTVRDVVTENKMSAPASSGISKKARTIQIGGLVGRTGGKWHLGKKVGKG